jgi:cbb3-type cytochrome oxidase subunit 3
MSGVGTGHYIFAGIFVLVFLGGMVYAYRKDLPFIGRHYRKVWLIIIGILVIYFSIFFLNRFS